jgi:hypothetical protein
MGMAFLTNRAAPAAAAASDNAGMEMTLLWENAKPTSTFAAQTVEIDFTGYEMCMIEYNYNSENNTLLMSQTAKIEVGYSIWLISVSGNASEGVPQSRKSAFVDSGISFDAGKRTGSTNNTVCVPVRVYGMKGVTWS